jgi:hypothetical protein
VIVLSGVEFSDRCTSPLGVAMEKLSLKPIVSEKLKLPVETICKFSVAAVKVSLMER